MAKKKSSRSQQKKPKKVAPKRTSAAQTRRSSRKSARSAASGSSQRKSGAQKTSRKTSRSDSSMSPVFKETLSEQPAAFEPPMRQEVSRGVKVLSLVLNMFVLPGLGTLIAGGHERLRHGIWQVVLALVGLLTAGILIGIPLVVAAWIWAFVDGIRILNGE